MSLKPSISLKLGQQLRMTPQLQQAIRLLQLSSVDLEMEIQEALDTNFMLEEIEADESGDSSEDSARDQADNESPDDSSQTNSSNDNSQNDTEAPGAEGNEPQLDPEIDGDRVTDSRDEVDAETIAVDLPVDSSWDEVYDDNFVSSAGSGDYSDDNFLETRNADSTSVQSHLLDQLNLLNLTESDQYIAAAILDGLDDEGVLQLDLQDVLEIAPPEWEIEIEEVEAVLHLIQHLDPVGIAARSLQECMMIQLRELPEDTEGRDLALNLVENHIALLANRDYVQLTRKLRVKEAQLKNVISLIQTLNPRPGSSIGPDKVDYIEPDVFVSKQNGRWTVELNPKSAPRIRVNPEYASLIKRGDTSDDATNMKNHLQEARWFIKSLQQRNDTLLRVATKIVEFQRGFFEYGEQAMKPLVLHDIAEAVELHESTISRVTTQKYMLTPGGVFELKYFFSSHVSTSSGGEVSSTAIRALIKQLVADENPRKPLSDSKIAKLLEEQNINVARRTIAKYRELLLIPPSNERKQLI